MLCLTPKERTTFNRLVMTRTLLLIVVLLGSHGVSSSRGRRSEVANNDNSRKLQPTLSFNDCVDNFYETTIGIVAYDGVELRCTPEEVKDIGIVLETAYDEVVNLDSALSKLSITLDTTVCTHPDEHSLRRRLLTATLPPGLSFTSLAKRKYKIQFVGGGTCNLCKPDNSDRRLRTGKRPRTQQHDERKLRFEAYEVVDFSRDGRGTLLRPNSYVSKEWTGRHGMQIRVLRGGYAPNKMARLLDSGNPGPQNRHLGSPNANCARGGPGVGEGGNPGQPGENCVEQRNVLIIQSENSTKADADPTGGVLLFAFASTTRIGHIGLMGVANGTATITVLTHDKQKIIIPFEGLGNNSVQQVHIDYAVKNVRVVFRGPGAVTEIGIFAPTTANEAISYRSGQSYLRNVSLFQEYIPYLEFDLSYYLTRKINDQFGAVPGHCLEQTWVRVDVMLSHAESLPVLADLKCGDVWLQCPSAMSSAILNYECTQGLQCLYGPNSAGESFECNCGSSHLFACLTTTVMEPKSLVENCPLIPPRGPTSTTCRRVLDCDYPFQVTCSCVQDGFMECDF